MIKLGDKVKDTVTGFAGIVVSKIEYLNGCMRLGIQAKMNKDGKIEEAQYFDIEQIKIVGKNLKVKKTPTGGFHPAPPQR